MNAYPAVGFLVRFGIYLAVGLSLVPLFAAVGLAIAGYWWLAAFALCAAPVLFLFLKSYVELVALISDMLIPR